MKSFDETWEKIHAEREWGKYPSEHVIRFVARNYYKSDRKNTKALDIGCGAGANTWFLAREGFDVYAFDGSKSAIGRVKTLLSKDNLTANLKVCDAIEMDYPNDYFDFAIDNFSICCNKMECIEDIYKRIFNILKMGGGLLVANFTTKTTGEELGDRIEKNTNTNISSGPLKNKGVIHFSSNDEITSILKRVGFIVTSVDFLSYSDSENIVDALITIAKKP